jgi:sodium/hydrogen antiporter
VGTLLGTDDLLVSFSAGCAFTWEYFPNFNMTHIISGWFTKKTEESHVSNVIDLLFNLSFFVYYGSIIPWSSMNSPLLTIVPWRLVVIAILILLFRRIPIILALKPVIPDIRSWREAIFCGHFGPIGVGAIFISILARGELENEAGHGTPTLDLPDTNSPNYVLIAAIWPIVSFLILSSVYISHDIANSDYRSRIFHRSIYSWKTSQYPVIHNYIHSRQRNNTSFRTQWSRLGSSFPTHVNLLPSKPQTR